MTGSGLEVLVILRSAWASTSVSSVELLLPGVGSVVVLLTVAVLLMMLPSATLGFTVPRIRIVKLPEAARVP